MFTLYLVATIVGLLFFRIIIIYYYKELFKTGTVGDSSVHYILIRHLKTSNKKIIDNFLIGSDPITYPTLFHKITGFLFNLKMLKDNQYLPNLLYFVAYSAIYVLLVYNVFTFEQALVSLIIFLFSTSNILFIRESKNYLKLSERYFARINTSLSYLCLILFLGFNSSYLLLSSIIFGVASVLSSKFARQVIIFLFPILSILTFDIVPLLTCVAIYLISYLIKGDELIESFKYMYLHLKNFSTANNSQRINVLSSFITKNQLLKAENIFEKLKLILIKEPVNLLIRFPEIIYVILIIFLYDNNPFTNRYLYVPILPVLIVYLITSTKRYNFLGEAHRYLGYSLYYYFPICLALLIIRYDIYFLIPTYIIINILALFVFKYLKSKFTKKEQGKNFGDFLKNITLDKSDVVYPIPLRLGPNLVVEKDCKTFWWQPGNVKKEYYDKFIEEYPYPKKDWEEIFKEYEVNFILCDKIKLKELKKWSYKFEPFQVYHENDQYILYKVK